MVAADHARTIAAGRCARVAVCGFARNTLDGCGGIRASSQDCVRAKPAVRATDYLDRRDHPCAWLAASAAGARADRRAPRNNIAVELEDAAEMTCRTLNIAYSP